MRKMMSGLETVNAKPVRMSFLGEDCSWGVQCRFVAGFLRNMYTPNATSTNEPISCRMFWLRVRNSSIKESPKAVIMQYMRSEIEAPMPVNSPALRPLSRVRWIHNTPTGPIGAEMTMPMTKALSIVYIRFSIIEK